MTQLKKTDRLQVLESVLKEAFEPRFQAIFKRIEEAGRQDVAAKYPHFVRAYADLDIRCYMATSIFGSDTPRILDNRKVATPIFGKLSEQPIAGRYGFGDTCCYTRFSGDLRTPTNYNFHIKDEQLTADYNKAWSDYQSAYSTLYDLLHGYTNREKFEADFPALAKYLPKLPQKVSLPAVQVPNIMADLARFGVPATAEE